MTNERKEGYLPLVNSDLCFWNKELHFPVPPENHVISSGLFNLSSFITYFDICYKWLKRSK